MPERTDEQFIAIRIFFEHNLPFTATRCGASMEIIVSRGGRRTTSHGVEAQWFSVDGGDGFGDEHVSDALSISFITPFALREKPFVTAFRRTVQNLR